MLFIPVIPFCLLVCRSLHCGVLAGWSCYVSSSRHCVQAAGWCRLPSADHRNQVMGAGLTLYLHHGSRAAPAPSGWRISVMMLSPLVICHYNYIGSAPVAVTGGSFGTSPQRQITGGQHIFTPPPIQGGSIHRAPPGPSHFTGLVKAHKTNQGITGRISSS